jgi:hypothetical protein
MDTGTAIFLASLSGPFSVLITTLWNRYETRVASENVARQLAVHNTEIATQLADNTALTRETKIATEETKQEMNGMKDALIKAEKTASEAKGLALGIEQGRAEEKARKKSE